MYRFLTDIREWLSRIRTALVGKYRLLTTESAYFQFAPPGHFYSPVPAISDIRKAKRGVLPRSLPGIDLNDAEQLMLVEQLQPFYDELPFTDHKTHSLRYYFLNPYYSYSDAIFYYCLLRYLKPKIVIEIGSGYSSCVLLDTNERFFAHQIQCIFIEPYPDRLKALLKKEDITHSSVKILEQKLQDVPVELFDKLQQNDILFIDSTHVSKFNSDVNYIIHEILPRLKQGVFIHFHDIFYPFEYPHEWLLEGRAWNESYILRAFLEFNTAFKIVLFNTYLEHFYRELLIERLPLIFKNEGGSLWLKRV
ncbi:MAG: class I SAM-dependent methyltransferase [Chloroherpetonaceae bacterium]|nr:class I SAM-dependent methyltransferase [Chloroherpetonaceae bacterium]